MRARGRRKQHVPADLGQPARSASTAAGSAWRSGRRADIQRLGRQQQAALRVALGRQLRLCGQRTHARGDRALLGQPALPQRLGCAAVGGKLLLLGVALLR